jgi:FMN reductase
MDAPRVVVVSAGLRTPSATRLLADQLASAATSALLASGRQPQVEIIELRPLGHEIVDALVTGFPAGGLRGVVGAVASADGLIVVSPTFSASYSGLFKAFFDLFDGGALGGIPTILAATGGTERHSLVLEHALRPLFTYLGASPVRTGVFAATADFGGEGAARLGERVTRAAGELAEAITRAADVADRTRRVPGSPGDVVPFDELLARGQEGSGSPAG